MIVYGAKISYFTGKLEAYLRYREIPYEYRPLDARHYRSVIPKQLGATQYPSVQLDDGRWMSDTTPMIAWLEDELPGPARDPGGPGPALRLPPGRGLRRRVALASRDALPLVVRAGPLPGRDPPGRGGRPDPRRAGVAAPRWVAKRQDKLFVRGDGIDAAHA